MNGVVCVKQVLDAAVPLRVSGGKVEQDAPWPIEGLGSADRAALDLALAMRALGGGTVTAVSVGGAEAVGALRYCLARGADRAAHADRPDDLDAFAAADLVAGALGAMPGDVVWCGGASGDGASGLFPAVLAAALDRPLVTQVAAASLEPDGRLRIVRRLERGDREVVLCPVPAVLAVDAAGTEPRYVSLRARRAAERLPIEPLRCGSAPAAPWELVAIEPAKPRPKRVSGPDSRLSAMDRLGHLLGGGVPQKQTGGFVEGKPEAVAAEIIRFLREKGFLAQA